jgi:uncharacterized protein (DUF2267 family)
MPWAIRHATKDWQAFLADAKERLNLTSDNSAYTAVDAVLQVFRRRLTVEEAIAFANLLPACLRALFVQNWDVTAPVLPFASRAEMTREAQAVRKDHNLTPDHAIAAVAWALRRHIHQRDLDALLAGLPKGAVDYWHVETSDPHELDRRIT